MVSYTKSSNVTISDAQLYLPDPVDWSGNLPPILVPNISVSDTGHSLVFTSSVDQEVLGTKVYLIRATVGGTLQTNDFITTSVQPGVSQLSAPSSYAGVSGAASFVWSNRTGSPHSESSIDWMDDYHVKATPSGPYLPTVENTMTR